MWSLTCLIDTCETTPCHLAAEECLCWCHDPEQNPKLPVPSPEKSEA